MARKLPKTIAEYIRMAPSEGRPHLRQMHGILKRAAPHAREVIKWGQPFFVDPRFVFAFSGHKGHCNFSPTVAAMKPFKKELARHKTTKYFLQIPYDQPFPATLVRKIARYRLRTMGDGDAFWV